MAKLSTKTVTALAAALAVAEQTIIDATQRRDELILELEAARRAENIQPGWIVSFATGRAATRALRIGVVHLTQRQEDGSLLLKVEVGQGFDAQFHKLTGDDLFSAGPAESADKVETDGRKAFDEAVAIAAKRAAAAAAKAKAEADAAAEQAGESGTDPVSA